MEDPNTEFGDRDDGPAAKDGLNGALPDSGAARLTDLEWLALLPARPPRPQSLPWKVSPTPDPAAEVRHEDPLTAARLLAILSPEPLLRRWAGLQLWFQPYVPFFFVHWLSEIVQQSSLFIAIPLVATVEGVTFTTRQMVTGLVAHTLCNALYVAAVIRSGVFQRKLLREEAGDAAGLKDSNTLDRSDMGHLARWLQLTSEGDASERGGALLAHREDDAWCPCSRPSCGGNEAKRAGLLAVAHATGWPAVLGVAYALFQPYTQIVTLAPFTWTQAWSASTAALMLALLVTLFYAIPVAIFSHAKSLPTLGLEGRMQRRSFSLALASLVNRCILAVDQAMADGPAVANQTTTLAPSLDTELHFVLYRTMGPVLRHRFAIYRSFRSQYLVSITIDAVIAFIYIIGSSCIPAYVLMSIAIWFYELGTELVTIARANSHVDAIVSLHLSARSELRMQNLRLGSVAPDLRAELASREKVLDSVLAEAPKLRATFADVPVTTGVVRTVAATVFTIGAGLFGIFRGSGVYVTVESICRG